MAKRARSKQEWLGKVRGSLTEARGRLEEDRKQREAAERGQHSVILDPNRLAGQDWDAATVLHTTLGGERRAITAEDLAAFRRNIKQLRGRIKGGIRARQVLDLSLDIDRERARKQIRQAIPASLNQGQMHVITNAGPQSTLTRHHLLVAFPGWDLAVADVNMTPRKAAEWLLKSPLKYDCDCGRHRFWYRYIATIGGYNAGRPEHGYPKIRNPQLVGVGCKHALRVMTELESSPKFLGMVTEAIKKARSRDKRKRVETKQAAAEQQAEQSPRALRTSAEIAYRRSQARAKAAARTAARNAKAPRLRSRMARGARGAAETLAAKFGVAGRFARQLINAIRRKK